MPNPRTTTLKGKVHQKGGFTVPKHEASQLSVTESQLLKKMAETKPSESK